MIESPRAEQIRHRLESALSPTILRIIDESHLHVGHPGAMDGASHFAIDIASPALVSLNRLQQHRLVYRALHDLIPHPIHALKINIVTA